MQPHARLRNAGIRALYGHALTPVTSNSWDESPADDMPIGELDHYRERLALATEIRNKYLSSPDQLLTFGICPQELPSAPMDEIAQEVVDSRALGARIVVHVWSVDMEAAPEHLGTASSKYLIPTSSGSSCRARPSCRSPTRPAGSSQVT